MKKKMYFIVITYIILICSACSSNEETYTYGGVRETAVDGRTFQLEDIPESPAEETLSNNFLYAITGEFDKMNNILADIDSHNISIENEKKAFKEGEYVESYIIHEISTLTKDEFSQKKTTSGETNELYYDNWEHIVDTYALEHFEVIRVNLTIVRSEKALNSNPQWDDGTYSRSFIVGKSATEKQYKIYDFGFM